MEKEQKKLLLVAVSVGVFLLVTITAAIIILTPLTPKVNTEETNFYSPPAVSSARTDNVTIMPPPAVNNSEPAADVENNTVRLIVEPQTTAGVPVIPDIAPSSSTRPVVTTAAAAARPAASPAPAAAQSAAARPAAAQAAPSTSRTVNDYWIQAGAYSAMVRAEDVKENLASKGLTSIIETRIVEGRNLYRVRLGPYTSENEANYWLKLIKEIDGFGESQVRQTVRQQ
jgi:DedD protein